MRSLILASITAGLGLLVPLTGFATESPYVGFEIRSIKSLSPEQIEQYRQGQVKAYNDLRGYADQGPREHWHHSEHRDG